MFGEPKDENGVFLSELNSNMLVRTRTMNKFIVVITIVLITDESVRNIEVRRREVKRILKLLWYMLI